MNTHHTAMHKSVLEIKSLDEAGRFAGYASVFNIVDSQQDIVERGAFINSIKGREAEIKLLWQHQFNEPIGVIDRLFEDARGLYIEGTLLLAVSKAREVYALMKAGVINGLSIGYTPIHYIRDADSGIRHITEAKLWEISLVTFPANEQAKVSVVKGMSNEEIQYWHTALATGEVNALAAALERAARAFFI